jgi:2-isopropylmalate synthase
MIAEDVQGPVICAITRSRESEIIRAADALKPAERSRLHIFLSPSDIFVEKRLRLSRERVIQMSCDAVKLATSFTPNVEFSPEDAAQADIAWFCDLLNAVIEAGATTVNISDTMGRYTPERFGDLIRQLRNCLSGLDGCILSAHCHNDLGLGVANSLAAVLQGARQVECTVNGFGERAGNAPLEEVVMNLVLHQDYYGVETAINTREIYRTSRLVSQVTGRTIRHNKPIVGMDAYAERETGEIAVAGRDRVPEGFLIPEMVGWGAEAVSLGRHSRRSAFRARLAEMGFSEISDEEFDRIYERFRQLSEQKKEVYDEEITAIIQEELAHVSHIYQLDYCHISSGTAMIPSATVRVRKGEDFWLRSSTGDGPIDAIYKALGKALDIDPKLEQYQIEAVTSGGDALAQVSIRLLIDEMPVRGTSTGVDIALASAKAYLDAVNRYEMLLNQPVKATTGGL